MKKTSLLIIAVIFALSLSAEIRLPKVISDNMVLQQGKNIAVWGYSDPNESIIVSFGKQTKKTKADDKGNWKVSLDPMIASAKPQLMTIKGAKSKVTLRNILVGEVWLASGQSNMEFTMNLPQSYKKPAKGEDYQGQEYTKAKNDLMRIMYVAKNLNADTLPSVGWQTVNSESLAKFSAPAYFFAKTLIDSLDIPVGVISTSWGGTQIEVWTPEQAYIDSPIFGKDIKNGILDEVRVGDRYDKMVKDMIPYTIKGFIWYQGESNLMKGDVIRYTEKQKVLVDSWRKLWMDDFLPFYYVQLAPYIYSQRRNDPVVSSWDVLPRFWEAQTLALNIPYSGMAVTTDLVDNPRDIHPSYKWEVGRRLAVWALAKDYNKNIVYSGPMFKSIKVDGNKAIIEFSHTGSGLISKDGKALGWFQIAGEDGRFRNAEAVIETDKIIVTSSQVKVPANVRFAWDELAMPNLFNKEGLPAIPFRTNSEKWEYGIK